MTVQRGLEDITLYIYIAVTINHLTELEGISLLYPDNRCLIFGIYNTFLYSTNTILSMCTDYYSRGCSWMKFEKRFV